MVASGRLQSWRLGLVAAAVALGACRPPKISCEVAVQRRSWSDLEDTCTQARWAPWRELALAYRALNENKKEAESRFKALLGTEVDADAAYFLGYLYGLKENMEAAREKLEHALAGHRRSGDRAQASKDAEAMSRTYDVDFDQRLHWAQVAEAEASLSEDPVIRGRAKRALAETYDRLGLANKAHQTFQQAAELLRGSPPELAYTYLKHGSFLQDRRSKDELRLALRYYDKAESAGPRQKDHLAIWINRAATLILLGQLEEADAALANARRQSETEEQQGSCEFIAGHLAASRNQPERAVRHFQRAEDIEQDFAWQTHLALAYAYQRAGHPDKQEASLREAMAVIEALRTKAKSLELRTWIQAHRREPHEELFVLLAAQGRHREALEIADQVVAGTWRDKVLGAKGLGSAHNLPLPASASTAPAGEPTELLFYFSLRDGIIWRAYLHGEALRLEPLPPDTEKILERLASPDANSQLFERAAAYLLPANLTESPAPLRIIANGESLALVPFAALPWRGRPLIFSRRLVFLPTRQEHPCTPATSAPVLMADSKGNLPAARREVQSVAAQLDVEPDLGSGATLARVGAARGSRLLHIATHGKQTATGRAMELADGYLTGPKVLELLDGQAPELVVLSGCATAQNLAPEPWDGLPTAFLAGGSRHVIATLRTIPDDQAAQVMHAYYAQPESLSPVERLAAAQRQLADKLPATVWASFTVWGGNCQQPSSQTAELAR